MYIAQITVMAPSTRTCYRVIAASLLASDVTEADRIAEALRAEGWPHANRSLVIREALARLADDLRGKTSEHIFLDFINRRGVRIPRHANPDNAG
jgi:hypothetical protein